MILYGWLICIILHQCVESRRLRSFPPRLPIETAVSIRLMWVLSRMRLLWVISAGLYSAHILTQLYRNNLPISKILNQNLWVGNDERISNVELVSLKIGVIVGHYRLCFIWSDWCIVNGLVIGVLSIVGVFSLCLLLRLIDHFDSLLLPLDRSVADIVTFKPLLRLSLCLWFLFHRLCHGDSLFEIIQRRVNIYGSIICIVDSFQLRLTVVLDRLIIHTCVLPRLLPIWHLYRLFLMENLWS